MARGIVWPVSLHLSDAEDDLIAAQELAEEAWGEVERIDLKELARQRDPHRRLRGHRRRGRDRRRGLGRDGRPRILGLSGGEVTSEAAATEWLLLLLGGRPLEARGRGGARGGHQQ